MPIPRLRVVLVSVAVLLLAATHGTKAHAAWPSGTTPNLPICTAVNGQYTPKTVSDGAGGVILCWWDARSGTFDLYAQRVSAAGIPLWTAGGVAICVAAGQQYDPVIAADGTGGAIVTWSDYRSGASDIYAQRINASGVVQWTANGIAISAFANDQYRPSIAGDGSGGAMISWSDARSGDFDIYAQRLNAAGASQWTAGGVAVCTVAGIQASTNTLYDGSAGAIIVWHDVRSGNYDIYAQRIGSSGSAQWTANGVPVCNVAGEQSFPLITSDGSGGAIIGWSDLRGATYDAYVQHYDPAGNALWLTNGTPASTAAGNQQPVDIAGDGVGGAILVWADSRAGNNDVYAQRVSGAGSMQWTPNGVGVCTSTGDQGYAALVGDGSSGAVIAWHDARAGGSNYDIYAQRVSAAGSVLWALDGVALTTVIAEQSFVSLASDGSGGAIVAWQDWRSGTTDIYAQRIERFGKLGSPEPVVTSVRDVPNDQGGKVTLRWTASYLDAVPANPIDAYWIWRQVPNARATRAIAEGARLLDDGSKVEPAERTYRRSVEGTAIYYWEYVGSQPSHGFPAYSYTASTLADSVGGSNPRTLFMVEAEQTSSGQFWSSAPDSGYSVDNLGPAAPAPFTAAYGGGATHLHWGANPEADLFGYRLYRGSSAGFVPGPGNLVSAQPDTGYDDPGAAGRYYKLSALDVHGNESGYALLVPNATTDADEGRAPAALWLAPASPNPTRDVSTVRFGIPTDGSVTLTLFDQQGRLVRELLRGVRPAGEHTVSWDGRDAAGRGAPAGIYFYRLVARGATRIQRIALVR